VKPSRWISSRLQTARSSRGSSSCTRSRSPRLPTPSLSWIEGGLAAHTAASSTARVHMRSRREACWRRFVAQTAYVVSVIVVPFALSGRAWPTLTAASRTSVAGQRDPCVIVPNSPEYARA
jgi:hypothetical protein